MKLVAIAGSIGEQSYNRMLLQYIARRFKDTIEIELLDINDVPMFNEDEDLSNSTTIENLYRKIEAADGVILATPEHNHTVPAAMKNILEWMSYKLHPFAEKTIWVIGASYFDQGSSRAQLHLKQILESPGINAIVMPGNEFLLSNAKEAFDTQGNLKDPATVEFLTQVLQKFIRFVKVISLLNDTNISE